MSQTTEIIKIQININHLFNGDETRNIYKKHIEQIHNNDVEDDFDEYIEPEEDYPTDEEIDRAFEEHEKWSDF